MAAETKVSAGRVLSSHGTRSHLSQKRVSQPGPRPAQMS